MISKPYRKLLIVSIILLVLISIVASDHVFAQNVNLAASSPQTETLTDAFFNTLGGLLNLLYMITLPVLVIAGKAMDNSMIYGEFMNLDRPLRMLWNLSRTFANFSIGWMMLRNIIKYIFSDRDGKSPKFLKDFIFKSVGIVLGINFSWFIIGALVDLSTIATYSLGAMPLSILQQTSLKDMPILSIVSYFDYESKDSSKNNPKKRENYIYYKRWNISIPQCNTEWKLYKWFITWPEYFPTIPNNPSTDFSKTTNGTALDFWSNKVKQYCALEPKTLADITALEDWKKTNILPQLWWDLTPQNNNEMNRVMRNIIDIVSTTGDCNTINVIITGNNETPISKEKLIELTKILPIGDGNESKSYCNGSLVFIDNIYAHSNQDTWQSTFLDTEWSDIYSRSSQQDVSTINTLINKSKGMVWPFITLYMSLLNFSNISVHNTTNATVATTVGWVSEFLLKSAVSLALFIPLIALAVTLIIRIVILRWVIAFVPLWIVMYGLDIGGKDGLKAPSWLGEWSLNAGSIIGLIFAPVLPVFAISISIVILQTLQSQMNTVINGNSPVREFLWVKQEKWTSCTDFWWLQTLCLDTGNEVSVWSGFTNFIPWLFLNIFAIGLMWMMVKFALSSNKLTSKLGGNIIDLWAKALGSIPLIKVWGKSVWASTLLSAPDKILNTADRALSTAIQQQDNDLQDLLTGGNKTFSLNEDRSKNIREIIWKDTSNRSFREKFTSALDEKQKESFSKLSQSDQDKQLIDFVDKYSTDDAKKQKSLLDIVTNNNTDPQKILEYINNSENLSTLVKDNTQLQNSLTTTYKIIYDQDMKKFKLNSVTKKDNSSSNEK